MKRTILLTLCVSLWATTTANIDQAKAKQFLTLDRRRREFVTKRRSKQVENRLREAVISGLGL